jgi:hypothetical protein
VSAKQWRKGLGLLPALGLMVGCGGVAGPEAAEGEPRVEAQKEAVDSCQQVTRYEDVVVSPQDDTYVTAQWPDVNVGQRPDLLVDGDPETEAYLRFSVVPGLLADVTVTRARLQLYAFDGSTDGPALYRVSSNWNQYTLTWNTRPALIGGPLADLGAVTTHSSVELDVSSVVRGEGTYAFGLVPTGGNGVDFYSGEWSQEDQRPRLVLTVARTYCERRGTGGDLAWARQRGGAGAQRPEAMAVSADGSQVVAVSFDAQAQLGGQTFGSPYHFALVKYGADGSHQWSRAHVPLASTDRLEIEDLILTPLGNILMVGGYGGAPDFGGGPLPATGDGNYGLFIAKFSPNGGFVWAHGFVPTGDGGRYLRAIGRGGATDANGSLIVTGHFNGRLNLGGATLDSGGSYSQDGMFLARFSWEGDHLWSLAVPEGTSNPWSDGTGGHDVVTNASGQIFVGGAAGTGRLGATSDSTPFIASYSPDGALLWSRAFNDAEGTVLSLAPMPGDAVAFGGFFSGAITFAGTTLTSPPDEVGLPRDNGFLGVMSASGGETWARGFGGNGQDYLHHIASDAAGNISVEGRAFTTIDLGGGLVGHPTQVNWFVARYGPTGEHRWSRVMDPSLETWGLSVLPDGRTVMRSVFSRPVTVDGTVLTPPDDKGELLFLKFDP